MERSGTGRVRGVSASNERASDRPPPSGAQMDATVGRGGAAGVADGSSRLSRAVGNTLESLRYRHYRYLWIGSLLGMGSFQMQTVARTILVDDLTGSAFITGVVAMGFAPTMLIMSLFGGVAGDRMERRRVIQLSQAGAAFIAFAIAVLIAIDVVHWIHLLIASLLQGVTFAFQMPARQAILPKLVGKENVTNAVSLNSAGMGIMTIVGPAIAGLVYGGVGPDAVYFLIGGMAVVAVIMTSRLPTFPPDEKKSGKNVFGDIALGVRYVRSERIVLLLLISSLASAVLTMPFRMQIPVFARRLYDIEPSEIGVLMAVMGVGAIVATLITANLRRGHHRGAILLLGGMGGSGVAMILMAALGTYTAGLVLMVLVGFAGSIRMTLGQSLAIEATDDEYRARVMSLQMMTFGLMPLGALPIGFAIDEFGASAAMVGIGVVTLAIGTLLYIASPSLRKLG